MQQELPLLLLLHLPLQLVILHPPTQTVIWTEAVRASANGEAEKSAFTSFSKPSDWGAPIHAHRSGTKSLERLSSYFGGHGPRGPMPSAFSSRANLASSLERY